MRLTSHKALLLFLIVLSLFTYAAFGPLSSRAIASNGEQDVDAEVVSSWISEAKPFVVLDVRTQEEFDAGHPEGAILIPLYTRAEDGSRKLNEDFLEQVKQTLSADQTVVVVCRSGVRSARATGMMREAGFNAAFNFKGGFHGADGWKAKGLPSSPDAADQPEKRKTRAGEKP